MKLLAIILALFFIPACVFSQTPFEVDANTVALWHFDEGVGDTLHDASPYHNDGVIHNGAWTTGKFDSALHFNGLSSYVAVPMSASLKPTNAFTIEAWINLDTLEFTPMDPPDYPHGIILSSFAPYPDGGYQLSIASALGFRFSYRTLTEVIDRHTGTTNIDSTKRYYHLAAVYKRAVISGNPVTVIKTFIDGVMTDSLTFSEQISYYNSFTLYIGTEPGGRALGGIGVREFPGIIDEIRISNMDRYSTEESPFTELSVLLKGIIAGGAIWGDYDNDGDLDILACGGDDSTLFTKIYRNDTGTFVDINAPLANLTTLHAMAWGDYDNDDDLDFVISGETDFAGTNIESRIYRNDNGVFVDINADIMQLTGGAAAWGDFDNDGDLDLLLTGSPDAGLTFYSKIYRNDDGKFVDINAGLLGVWGSSAEWGDYDNDGDLDILLTGYGGGNIATVFRNDSGEFVNVHAALQPVNQGQATWGDYENDGDLDILLTGSSTEPYTKIYRNGNGVYTDINAALTALCISGAAWGDYDGDGDLDILIQGSTTLNGSSAMTKIYSNDGGTFVEVNANIAGQVFGTVAWGDYDNDGDLDILETGANTLSFPREGFTRIYRNNSGSNKFVANTAPVHPTNLNAISSGDSVVLSWDKATDSQTTQNSLTYNIRLGSKSSGVEIVSPLSNSTIGYRQVVHFGNTSHLTGRTIRHLSPGTYFWSVQAIDNAWSGSTFASEQQFTIDSEVDSRAPYVLSITDVPHDEGKRVILKWTASSLDTQVTQLPFYSVWRSLPDNIAVKSSTDYRQAITQDFDGPAYRTSVVNGTAYVWEWLINVPAHYFSSYSYTAETLYDSMSGTEGKHYFLVSAHTGDPNIFYDSDIDSGYSVDNLAPHPPQNLALVYIKNSIGLHWNSNNEIDLGQYLVFRSSTAVFDINKLSPIGFTRDTLFMDEYPLKDGVSYYVVCAQDKHGNLSSQSNIVIMSVNGILLSKGGVPSTFELYQNFPNPFNPSTTIAFDVAHEGWVSAKVYNTLGQEISTLIDNYLYAGSYQIKFDGSQQVSGVYFYNIVVVSPKNNSINYTNTKKFLLLK